MVLNEKKSWEDLRLYYQYIRDIDKYALLSKDEERRLLERIRDKDTHALKKLVCSNLKFVINVAFKYRGQGFSLPELINEGNIGLIEAAERFDLSRNIRFISYAVWWIRQSITRALSEKARIVRISAEKELILKRVIRYNVKMKYLINGGLCMDTKDLSEKMGFSQPHMDKILEMGQLHASLNHPVNEGSGATMMDLVADEKSECSDERAVVDSRNAFLEKQLDLLDGRERRVLRLYFGLETHQALSLEDIGDLVGLSKERVRQIKEDGLASLRRFNLPRDLLLAA